MHEACNPMYCRIVGRPRDALLNRAAREVLPELEAQGVWAGLDLVRSTREPFIAKALLAAARPPSAVGDSGNARGLLLQLGDEAGSRRIPAGPDLDLCQ